MSGAQSDLFEAPLCTWCGGDNPQRRRLADWVGASTGTVFWLCDHVCEANWGTNQPKPPAPRRNSNRPSLALQMRDMGR